MYLIRQRKENQTAEIEDNTLVIMFLKFK
jgi:hypothetical protein